MSDDGDGVLRPDADHAGSPLQADDEKVQPNQCCSAYDHHRKKEASHHQIMSHRARADMGRLRLALMQRFLVDFQFLNQQVNAFLREPVGGSHT